MIQDAIELNEGDTLGGTVLSDFKLFEICTSRFPSKVFAQLFIKFEERKLFILLVGNQRRVKNDFFQGLANHENAALKNYILGLGS